MKTIGLLCGMLLVAALSGCGGTTMTSGGGSTAGSTPRQCTNDDPCTVMVKVVPVGTSSCDISYAATDEILEMKGSFNRHTIRWILDDATQDTKFRFAGNGIELKSTDPYDEIKIVGPSNGGREFEVKDKNKKYHDYPYTINIWDKSNHAVNCKKDPRIVNN